MGDELKKDDLNNVAGGYTRRPEGACSRYYCDECHARANCGVCKDGETFYSVFHEPSCSQYGNNKASCETCSEAFGETGCSIDWF